MLKTNKVHVRKENENNLQVIMFYKIHNSCKPVCHFRKEITPPPHFSFAHLSSIFDHLLFVVCPVVSVSDNWHKTS